MFQWAPSEALLLLPVRLAVLEREAARVLVESRPLAVTPLVTREHDEPEPENGEHPATEAAHDARRLAGVQPAAVAVEGARGMVQGRDGDSGVGVWGGRTLGVGGVGRGEGQGAGKEEDGQAQGQEGEAEGAGKVGFEGCWCQGVWSGGAVQGERGHKLTACWLVFIAEEGGDEARPDYEGQGLQAEPAQVAEGVG